MTRLLLGMALLASVLPGADLRGSWKWTCCRGQHRGTFQITTQNADGSFTGRFGDTVSDGKSPISGRISGNSIEFTRRIIPAGQNQLWKARLSSDAAVMLDGHWSGYSYVSGYDEFRAERVGGSTTVPAQQVSSSILGRWSWSCCQGTHAGTFTVSAQDAQGRIRGRFGNNASDNATPFAGTYQNGELVFTRTLTGSLAGRQQQWRARVTGSGSSLRTTGGQWSGHGAAAGYTDFQATFLGTSK